MEDSIFQEKQEFLKMMGLEILGSAQREISLEFPRCNLSFPK